MRTPAAGSHMPRTAWRATPEPPRTAPLTVVPAMSAPVGGSSAIEVAGVSKRFGSTQALAGVDLVAQEGKVLGLLGPNGAGKTTLVRILATLLKPDSGLRDGRRMRRGRGRWEAALADRPHGPVRSRRRAADRAGEPRARRAPLPPEQGRAAPPSPGRARALLAGRRRGENSSRPTRAGCAGAWTSEPASSGAPAFCSWTSRPPAWTHAPATTCGGSSRNSSPAAPPCC